MPPRDAQRNDNRRRNSHHKHSTADIIAACRACRLLCNQLARIMGRLFFFLLLHLAVFLLAAAASQQQPKARHAVTPVDFVRRSCRSTRFPSVCERSLMPLAPAVGRSPRRLAQAALTVGADRARSCSAYLSPPFRSQGGSSGAIKDCAQTLRDAEERLRQSAGEMTRMGRANSPRFAWRLSNVQTWASAALTDTSTCLDSLATYSAGGADVDAVRRRVIAVAQATSNALALVNQLDPASHQ